MGESLAERLASLVSPGPNGSDIKQLNTPEAWRPRMEVGPEGGFIVATARPTAEMPDAITILEEFKLDPEHWTVTSLRRGQWQKFDGEWLESVRINVVPSSTIRENDLDLEKLISEISKWRPSTKEKKVSGELAYVFAPSDQQVGKKGSGGGTIDLVARILETTEGGVHRLKELRKIGRPIGTVAIEIGRAHV